MSLIIKKIQGKICILELNHSNKHNPFNEALENDVKSALKIANEDQNIKAIIVTGGRDRSFSVGGDFNEVKNLSKEDDIDRWIDRVINLYLSILKVNKPIIAAIDGHAIGMGFQFAMMFDWRIMSKDGAFSMPELQHGIGCSVGATILSNIIGLNNMKEIIFSCDVINYEKAMTYGIVNEVVDKEELMNQALIIAEKLANYPDVAFRNTKKVINKVLIDILHATANESKQVHRAAFAARDAQNHFKNILGKKY